MSVTIEANILIYASNAGDPFYEKARAVVAGIAEGPAIAYLFWPTTMAYLRIVTHPTILPRPLAPADAMGNIKALLERPHVRSPGEGEGFWRDYSATVGPRDRGNAVPDVHLAALMQHHGVRVIYTRDRGFGRFDGIEPRDPFT